jgi:hypothetical protein
MNGRFLIVKESRSVLTPQKTGHSLKLENYIRSIYNEICFLFAIKQ